MFPPPLPPQLAWSCGGCAVMIKPLWEVGVVVGGGAGWGIGGEGQEAEERTTQPHGEISHRAVSPRWPSVCPPPQKLPRCCMPSLHQTAISATPPHATLPPSGISRLPDWWETDSGWQGGGGALPWQLKQPSAPDRASCDGSRGGGWEAGWGADCSRGAEWRGGGMITV